MGPTGPIRYERVKAVGSNASHERGASRASEATASLEPENLRFLLSLSWPSSPPELDFLDKPSWRRSWWPDEQTEQDLPERHSPAQWLGRRHLKQTLTLLTIATLSRKLERRNFWQSFNRWPPLHSGHWSELDVARLFADLGALYENEAFKVWRSEDCRARIRPLMN